jgi:hypothetical protein
MTRADVEWQAHDELAGSPGYRDFIQWLATDALQ